MIDLYTTEANTDGNWNPRDTFLIIYIEHIDMFRASQERYFYTLQSLNNVQLLTRGLPDRRNARVLRRKWLAGP